MTTTQNSNESIITSILEKMDSFPSMNRVINSNYISGPASIYLPNTIKNLDNEFTHNPDLVHECFNFIDTIKLLSVAYRGEPNALLEEIMFGLNSTRTVSADAKLIASESVNDYTYIDADATSSFFSENIILFSLYVYCVIDFTYGK